MIVGILIVIFKLGKTGDWKNHFSPEMSNRIDEWIKSSLDGSDLSFISELDHQD